MSGTCPHCGRGELEPRTIDETIRYDGSSLVVHDIEVSVCPSCHEEIVLPEQAKANELRFADAKRHHDKLLASGEIIAWRKRHRLSQADAAKLFGGGVNAFSKYERGEVIQSKSMDLLMRAAQAVPGVLSFLKSEANFDGGFSPVEGWEVAGTVISIRRARQGQSAPLVAVNEGDWSEDSALRMVSYG